MDRIFKDKKCNHENNRFKVCAGCGKKIVVGKKKIEYFAINCNLEQLLKKHLNPKFDISSPKFPLSICISCKLAVLEHEKEILKRKLPVMPNFDDIQLPAATRSHNDSDCNCFICLTARHSGHVYSKSKDSVVITAENGLNGSAVIKKNKQIDNVGVKNDSLRLCSICLSQIGRGKPHKCSVTKAPENVLQSVENLPEKQKEQVVLLFNLS